jgi:hypothetical protein
MYIVEVLMFKRIEHAVHTVYVQKRTSVTRTGFSPCISPSARAAIMTIQYTFLLSLPLGAPSLCVLSEAIGDGQFFFAYFYFLFESTVYTNLSIVAVLHSNRIFNHGNKSASYIVISTGILV